MLNGCRKKEEKGELPNASGEAQLYCIFPCTKCTHLGRAETPPAPSVQMLSPNPSFLPLSPQQPVTDNAFPQLCRVQQTRLPLPGLGDRPARAKHKGTAAAPSGAAARRAQRYIGMLSGAPFHNEVRRTSSSRQAPSNPKDQ